MTRDYARKKRPAAKKKPLPGWAWLLAGLAAGLLVAFLVYLSQFRGVTAGRKEAPAAKAAVKKPDRTAAAKAKPKGDGFKFEFYDILPELEVVVPDEETGPKNTKPPKPIAEPGRYLLQVGSFRSAGEADTRKAELALLGMASSVQTVTIDGRATWHRVRIGPFQDLKRLNDARALLKEHGIEFLLLKEKT